MLPSGEAIEVAKARRRRERAQQEKEREQRRARPEKGETPSPDAPVSNRPRRAVARGVVYEEEEEPVITADDLC